MIRISAIILLLFAYSYMPAQQFEDITNDSGVFLVPEHQDLMGGGVTWLDYDNDGYSDAYFTGCLTRDALFKNNGDGSFSDVTLSAGLGSTAMFNTLGVIKGDINNDGYDEIFLTVWGESNSNDFASNMLFLNNGDGTFSDISQSSGIQDSSFSTSAVFLDVNLDSFLDIYVLNYLEDAEFILDEEGNTIGFDHVCYDNLLYMNNGDATFTESAEDYGLLSGGCGLAVSSTDVDKDGDPDIQIANDFGEFITPNQLFINDYPNSGFIDASAESEFDIGLYGMGVASGDIDNDLDLDYYITNLGRNSLLIRDDNELSYLDIAEESGTENTGDEFLYTSWGDLFADIDNDKFVDLYVANGHIPAASFIQNYMADPNKLFYNNGDLTFSDISESCGLDYEGICRGAAYSDFNKDGLIDLTVSGIENPFFSGLDGVRLYENKSENSNNWIGFTLEGTTVNSNAYGSSVTLYSGQDSFYRELSGGSSHLSQNESILHFGIGGDVSVDSAVVRWIGGQSQVVLNPEIGVYHHIIQDIPSFILEAKESPEFFAYPNPTCDLCELSFKCPQGLLRVKNVMGQVVFEKEVDESLQNIYLRLSSGTYIATVHTEEATWITRILISD